MAIRAFFRNRNILWWASLPIRAGAAGIFFVLIALLMPGDKKARDEMVKDILEGKVS